MSSKVQHYENLQKEHSANITASAGAWKNYLHSSAKMYKYSFGEQVLIHAQNPNATACATYEQWRDIIKRPVKRGSKGIGLLDKNNNKTKMKYVYDVSNTAPARYNVKNLQIWQLNSVNSDHVDKMLMLQLPETQHGISTEGLIHSIAIKLTKGIIQQEGNAISELAGDNDGRIEAVQNLISASASYAAMLRCGLDADGQSKNLEQAFAHIESINTQEEIVTIGTYTSQIAETILRGIETSIKQFERSLTPSEREVYDAAQRAETTARANLQLAQGLSSTGHPIAEIREGNNEIRDAEEKILRGTQAGTIHDTLHDRAIVQPLPDDRGAGNQFHRNDSGTDTGLDEGERRTERGIERHDGMDRDSGERENAGRGNSTERDSLQVENSSETSRSERQLQVGDEVFAADTKWKIIHLDIETRSPVELESIDDTTLTRKAGIIGNYNEWLETVRKDTRNAHLFDPAFVNDEILQEQDIDPEPKQIIETGNAQPLVIAEEIEDIPTEAQQINALQREEYLEETTAPLVITAEDVQERIRQWNGSSESKVNVYEYFQDQQAQYFETALYLKNEYYSIPDNNLPAYAKGLNVEKKNELALSAVIQALTWPAIHREIRKMIDSGTYLTPQEIGIYNARAEARQALQRTSEPSSQMVLEGNNGEVLATVLPKKQPDNNRAIFEQTIAETRQQQVAEAANKAIREATHGFADNLPPMQKERVLSALEKPISTKNFGIQTTKEFV